MGRKQLTERRILVSSRVVPRLKRAIDLIAKNERRNLSQTVEILIEESPRIKAELRRGGK